MTEKFQIYKCEICGNIVEVVHPGAGELVCCGQPMKLMEEQTAEMSTEKHVPVVDKKENGYRVYVGSAKHPMEENHYIEWIEIITRDGKSLRKYLKPGDEPEAFFEYTGEIEKAREFCSVHLLWKNDKV
ncbi:desulfoferrodoxin [bacterium]|nr:desulfoferrodoxin [bacterium]